MKSIPAQLRRQVVLRAGDRCEYCGLAQDGQEATFHIDHIVPSLINLGHSRGRGGSRTASASRLIFRTMEITVRHDFDRAASLYQRRSLDSGK
jgi:hypothetical protein